MAIKLENVNEERVITLITFCHKRNWLLKGRARESDIGHLMKGI